MKRSIIGFAWLPCVVDGGIVWLQPYIKNQEFTKVLVHESAGYPDEGEWVEEDRWVTTSKTLSIMPNRITTVQECDARED
jgi:hypothetical protein